METIKFDPGKRKFLKLSLFGTGFLGIGAILDACGTGGTTAAPSPVDASNQAAIQTCTQVQFGDTALKIAGGYNTEIKIFRPDGFLKYEGPAVNAPGLFVFQENGVNDPSRSDRVCINQ